MHAHLKMSTAWQKKWEFTGQLECNGFHLSILYGSYQRQETNIQRAVIGTRVVFCPEFLFDASRHEKEKNEAHNRRYNFVDLWKMKKTFEHLGKNLGLMPTFSCHSHNYWVLPYGRRRIKAKCETPKMFVQIQYGFFTFLSGNLSGDLVRNFATVFFQLVDH